jgi:hypothetical protein
MATSAESANSFDFEGIASNTKYRSTKLRLCSLKQAVFVREPVLALVEGSRTITVGDISSLRSMPLIWSVQLERRQVLVPRIRLGVLVARHFQLLPFLSK